MKPVAADRARGMKLLSCMLAACALGAAPAAHAGEKADLVLVEKGRHLLSLYKSGKLLASFRVSFGGDPVGPKQKEGDGKTPEGRYVLDYRRTDSGYYKAFHVSYPDAKDRERAKQAGVSPGGAIMIHGQKNGWGWASAVTQKFDWTKGCIAVSNRDMNALWQAVDAGTPIEIRP